MKKRIHINKHVIRKNTTQGTRDPVITVKTYKENTYGHEVVIMGQDGKPAAKLVYQPDKPLNCGARVWIETDNDVEIIVREDADQTRAA